MSNNSREANQECLRQIALMRPTHGTESYWSAILGEAARSLGFRPAAPPPPNLSDPALRLDFFGQILVYAVFPHITKHALACGSDINSKSKACEWICEQKTVGALRRQRIPRSFFRPDGHPLRVPVSKDRWLPSTYVHQAQGGHPIICPLEVHFRPPHSAEWLGPHPG